MLEADCEDQALAYTKECLRWGCRSLPPKPMLVKRGQFWCCPKCGGSYGTETHPELT